MIDPQSLGFGSALPRPRRAILGMGYAVLIDAARTGGAYELIKFVVPGGEGPPLHVHAREDECFYVLEGEFEAILGDQAAHLQPGDFLHLPRGVPHRFHNTGAELGSFLCWVIPGNLEKFFGAFACPWPDDAPLPPPAEETHIQRMLAVADQFGISMLVPPE